MCIAIPGKVILIKGKKAKIKQRNHSHWIDISPLKEEVKKGDYLVTYQEVAVNKVSSKEAGDVLKLMDSTGDTGIKSSD